MFRLICGTDRRQVRIHETRTGAHVDVDGAGFDADVEEVAPGTFILRGGGRVETFHCVRDGERIHLFWRGVPYVLTEERESVSRASRHVEGNLEAPMPGKVITLNAAPGAVVARGDALVVVEAMKMENVLRAPRDGRVKAVRARVGDMVAPGVVLVELE